jgi:hypothetical protein
MTPPDPQHRTQLVAGWPGSPTGGYGPDNIDKIPGNSQSAQRQGTGKDLAERSDPSEGSQMRPTP